MQRLGLFSRSSGETPDQVTLTPKTRKISISRKVVHLIAKLKPHPPFHAVKLLTPGGHGRTSVYSSEYRQDYENDSSTDEEPMEDNSSDEEGDFVSK